MSRILPAAIALLVAQLVQLWLPAPCLAGGSLKAAIQQALDTKPPAGAVIGVHVVDLSTGKTVYGRNADRRFNPASGVKLVTTAAALDLFGPEHTFVTRVMVQKPPVNGVVEGDLVLVGGGDPALMTRDLWRLAHLVRAHGIKRVRGDLVLDASWFDDNKVPPKFDKKDSDHAYRAYVGACASDYGTLQVRVRPGAAAGAPLLVVVDPPGAGKQVQLDNRGVTKAGRNRLVVGTVPLPGQDKVVVRGSLPPDGKLRTVLRRTDFPDETAIRAFHTLLASEGIKVSGKIRVTHSPALTSGKGKGAGKGKTSPRPLELGRHPSLPLPQLIGRLNQWSNNFMAEMLLKNIGARSNGRRGGSSAKGAEAVTKFLVGIGVPNKAFLYGNGSGLYDSNQFTPRALTTVLATMHGRADVSQEYVASLAVGGRPGTLQSRLRHPKDALAGRVRAKTGTLQGAISLSGYAFPPGDRGPYAFSILMNNLRGVATGRRNADGVAKVLATWSPTSSASAAPRTRSVTPAPPPPTPNPAPAPRSQTPAAPPAQPKPPGG